MANDRLQTDRLHIPGEFVCRLVETDRLLDLDIQNRIC